jgi:hypothetical protein
MFTRQLQKRGMGKPLFKASDGGRLEVLRAMENVT